MIAASPAQAAEPRGAASPPSGRFRRLLRSRFAAGFLCGVCSLVALKIFIDKTTVADYLAAPLLPGDTPGRGDVIVVLGAGVSESCRPNSFAIQRVLLAARLYAERRAPYVLITGGRPHDSPCSVAHAMTELAVAIGIPPDRIRMENAAHNTWENAQFSKPILDAMGARRLVLVTDRLHMRRSEGCFRHFGYDVERAAVHTPDALPDNTTMLTFAGREAIALAYYWLQGRVSLEPTVQAAEREHAEEPTADMVAAQGPSPPLRHPSGPLVVLGASVRRRLAPGGARNHRAQQRQRRPADVRADRALRRGRHRPAAARGADLGLHQRRLPCATRRRGSGGSPRSAGDRGHGRRVPGAGGRADPGDRGDDSRSILVVRLVRQLGGLGARQDELRRVRQRTGAAAQRLAPRVPGRREGLLVLDLQTVLADASGTRRAEFADADGSHIPEHGYAALDRYAVPLLQAHLRRP